MSWKQTKQVIDVPGVESIFLKMNSYWPFGPKEDEYKEYQKLLFVKENVDSVPEDVVNEHSVALWKLHQWIVHAIELRIDDVKSRRQQKTREREQRQEAQDREAERLEKREEALAAAKEKFDLENEQDKAAEEAQKKPDGEGEDDEDEDDMPEFEMEEFDAKFNDENPPIEIPDEVVDDIDNDFNIEIEEEEV